ncbi:hypothetical protein D3C80_2149510 [compost metagenome]
MAVGKKLIEIALTEVVVVARLAGINPFPLGIQNPTLLKCIEQKIRLQAEHLIPDMPAQEFACRLRF